MSGLKSSLFASEQQTSTFVADMEAILSDIRSKLMRLNAAAADRKLSSFDPEVKTIYESCPLPPPLLTPQPREGTGPLSQREERQARGREARQRV